MDDKIRPTKKQQEILVYISQYISSHGYSPSYREIMSALNYNSVATVALHVTSLIKRGHLIKRDHSARSLELTENKTAQNIISNLTSPAEEKWLVEKVDYFFKQVEGSGRISSDELEKLSTLLQTLQILGFESAALSFSNRLNLLKDKL